MDKELLEELKHLKSNKKKSTHKNCHSIISKQNLIKSFAGNNCRIRNTGSFNNIDVSSISNAALLNKGHHCLIQITSNNSYLFNYGNNCRINFSGYRGTIYNNGSDCFLTVDTICKVLENYGENNIITCNAPVSEIRNNAKFCRVLINNDNCIVTNTEDFVTIIVTGSKTIINNTGSNVNIICTGFSNKVMSSKDANSVAITCFGKESRVSASLGTIISFAENNYISIVASIDEASLFPETLYTLYNGEIKECVDFGGVTSLVVKRFKHVYEVIDLHDNKKYYIISTNNTFAIGDTIKEAKNEFIYKIDCDNVSKYLEKFKKVTLDDRLNYRESIELIRSTTHMCESGTKEVFENIEYFTEVIKNMIERGEIPKDYMHSGTIAIRDILKAYGGKFNWEYLFNFFQDRITREDIEYFKS